MDKNITKKFANSFTNEVLPLVNFTLKNSRIVEKTKLSFS